MASDLSYSVYAERCPTRLALDRISSKWTALVIGLLDGQPRRFNELRRAIGGISHKVLTETLRHLEDDGLVRRTLLNARPLEVEYRLTPLGQSLSAPLAAVRIWAEQHIEELLAARRRAESPKI
jgi:DNA-binding HxlR family transcriptional regulator